MLKTYIFITTCDTKKRHAWRVLSYVSFVCNVLLVDVHELDDCVVQFVFCHRLRQRFRNFHCFPPFRVVHRDCPHFCVHVFLIVNRFFVFCWHVSPRCYCHVLTYVRLCQYVFHIHQSHIHICLICAYTHVIEWYVVQMLLFVSLYIL